MYSPHEAKVSSALHESIVAKFGSRIELNFRPQTREIFFSPMGRFFDAVENFNFGVLYDGIKYALPFGNRHTDFQYIEQHEYADRIVFVCRDFRIGIKCEISFIAPFVPQNEKLCTLPALFCEVKAERLIDRIVREDDIKEISLFCDARMTSFFEDVKVLRSKRNYILTDDHIHYQDTESWKDFQRDNPYMCNCFEAESVISCADESALDGRTLFVKGEISQVKSVKARFVLAGYVKRPVMLAGKEEYSFLYTKDFKDVDAVNAYALEKYDELILKSQNFCRLLQESSLNAAFYDMFAFGFRSYAANTWFCISGEKKWFSVWEGNCLFHSTVDVEYNIAVFYLLFWPELLEYDFANWKKSKKEGFLSHDIGGGLNVNGAAYPHEMQVEENCNFILMLFAYSRMFGEKEIVKKYFSLVKELIEYNKGCDKTGNGLANEGTANTIDDSSDNVQFAQEQIYLGVKEYAAYKAAEEMSALMNDGALMKLCKEESGKIQNTIEKYAWLQDHYAVNLIASDGKLNKESIYKSVGAIGDAKGKDAYSIYTANGLLYLFMAGAETGWDKERLRKDIRESFKKSKTPYGCTHSDVDKSNVWISQNIWRDMIACYLGVDMTENVCDYWDYEVYENQGGRGGCFIDTYGWNKLNYYPRGITVAGMLYAVGGVGIDGIKKEITINPCKVPVRVPIFQFADWEKSRVPVIDASIENGEMIYNIENKDLLSGFTIRTKMKEGKQ